MCVRVSRNNNNDRARDIPSSEVMREPVVAESIFCVMDVVTSTGLPMTFGSAGMSSAPLPAGCSILSWDCPCVLCEAMSCDFPIYLFLLLLDFGVCAPADAGSCLLGDTGGEMTLGMAVDDGMAVLSSGSRVEWGLLLGGWNVFAGGME